MSRLIDADALKDRLQSLAYDDWNQGVCTSWADAYRECADMVDEQPTIEPERKKGRWIMAVGTSGIRRSKCSECGKYYPHDPEFPFNVPSEYNYCPHCGADMRGDRMDDLISRQAAIDSIEKHLRFGDELYPLTNTDKVLNHGFEIAASCVYNLPSAQPELIRCKDCKHNSNTGGNYTNCNVLPQMFGRKPEDNYCSYAERRPDK